METSMNLKLRMFVFVRGLTVLVVMATVCEMRFAFAQLGAEPKPDAANTIVEGVGWKNVRVGMTREDLVEALGKPDNDPASDWLKWADKHIDCTFHTGSLVVSEVRFNRGFNDALANGLKLGSSGSAMLKLYGESDHAKVRPNGARQYEYSTRGILFWTYQGEITQIVVFKPYSLTRIEPAGVPPRVVSTSPANGAKEVDPATAEVTVTFDRDMGPGFTWNGNAPEYPFLPEGKAFWRDQRTCVLPVKLEPGRNYCVGLNTFSANQQSFRSVEGVRAIPTAIHFATRGTGKPNKSEEAFEGQPEPPKMDPTSKVVMEGVGWKGFRIGATRAELTQAYGKPDSNPGNPWVRWLSRHHVDCLFGKDGRAVEVRFNEGFAFPLTSGVKIGSSEKEVLAAYGAPAAVTQQPQAKMFVFGSGVIMWLMDGKVFDFTVITPTNKIAKQP